MTEPRPFEDLSPTGLLWLINRTVFHPRGLALALHRGDDGKIVGWTVDGHGGEVWSFAPDDDDEGFERADRFLRQVRSP